LDQLWEREPLPRLRPILASLSPPGSASKLTIEDSAWGCIYDMAIDADGSRAVLKTRSGFACWDIRRRTVRHIAAEDESKKWKARLSRDGNRAAFCTGEGKIVRWDLTSEIEPVVVADLEQDVTAFALSPDGTRAACALADKTIAVCELESGSVRSFAVEAIN